MNKKKFKFAVLGLIFALCCVFVFFWGSFISVKVNATTGENEETNLNYDFVGKTYTLTNEETKEVIVFKVISNAEIEITYGETTKKTTYIVHSLKNRVLAIKGAEGMIYFTLNADNTISEYDITKEENGNVKQDVEDVLIQAKDIVVLVFSILASFGITGSAVGALVKFIKGTNKEEKNELKESRKALEDTNNKAKEIQLLLIEKWEELNEHSEEIKKVYELLEKLYNDQEERQKLIREVVNETLGDVENESKEKGNNI